MDGERDLVSSLHLPAWAAFSDDEREVIATSVPQLVEKNRRMVFVEISAGTPPIARYEERMSDQVFTLVPGGWFTRPGGEVLVRPFMMSEQELTPNGLEARLPSEVEVAWVKHLGLAFPRVAVVVD